MIERPTVLVLGAGASQPYGFPSALKLMHDTISGVKTPGSHLRTLLKGCGFKSVELDDFAQAMATSGRRSIDAFLEGRPDYRPIGTAAIAAALIPCESWFSLHGADDAQDWYRYLWNAMGNQAKHLLMSNKLKVLTFNYDRSVEAYLIGAAMGSWGLSEPEATQLVLSAIEVVHLHGQLGRLPNAIGGPGDVERRFLPDVDSELISLTAQGIKIVHDDIDDDAEFLRAREILDWAEVVCFLGFGFAPPNVHRLFYKTNDKPRVLIGSAKDIKYGERFQVRRLVNRRVVLLDERWTCLDALREAPVLNWDDYASLTSDFSAARLWRKLDPHGQE